MNEIKDAQESLPEIHVTKASINRSRRTGKTSDENSRSWCGELLGRDIDLLGGNYDVVEARTGNSQGARPWQATGVCKVFNILTRLTHIPCERLNRMCVAADLMPDYLIREQCFNERCINVHQDKSHAC